MIRAVGVPVGSNTVRLAVSIGHGTLLSEVTADAVVRLELAPGTKVVALVKSVAVGR